MKNGANLLGELLPIAVRPRCLIAQSPKEVLAHVASANLCASGSRVIDDTIPLIRRLAGDNSVASDQAIVTLFQLWTGETIGRIVAGEVAKRRPRLLPLLRIYRDRYYPLAINETHGYYRFCRVDPGGRRRRFDSAMASAGEAITLGISSKVWNLLKPVLDARQDIACNENGANAAWDTALTRLIANRTPEAAEALVLMPEFSLDGSCREDVIDEVYDRGAAALLEQYA